MRTVPLAIVTGLAVFAAGAGAGWRYARMQAAAETAAWRAKYEAAEQERIENTKKMLEAAEYCDRVMETNVRDDR